MPRYPRLQFSTLLDTGFDRQQDRSELLRLCEQSHKSLSREWDWNDQNTLFEGGPRAARDRRASRFADC